MTDQPLWTLDELTARVAAALAEGYGGAPSGRIRDVPDARTVRWYTTRGLVDPPLAMRGRQALYGHRHLLQLVAVKRRQSEGAPLALIQTELAGLPDAALAKVAALPGVTPGPRPVTAAADVVPADPARPALTLERASSADPEHRHPTDGTGHRVRFWATQPARPASPRADHRADHRADQARPPALGLSPNPNPALDPAPEPDLLCGIRLAAGVVLLLDPDPAARAPTLDVAALREAARPLLELLSATQPHATQPHATQPSTTRYDAAHRDDAIRTYDPDRTDDGGIR